jgi:rhodanese-related sulfurtransferase/peroxiredoxin
MIDALRKFLRWAPLAVGDAAPPMSLTADDGTWIKLPDFKGHLNVVLVFLGSLDAPEVDRYLRALDADRERFAGLDTAVFAVGTSRTDQLRAYRQRLGVELSLLYDMLAVESRGFRASGRVRPSIRDTVVVVGKDGRVLLSERGFPDADRLVAALAAAEGRPAPERVAAPPAAASTVRTPGQASASVIDVDSAAALALLTAADSPFLLVDVRTKAEFERERSPAARHIPVDELPHRYHELGQTTHLVFVCQGGGRSASAAEFMVSVGANHVYNVVGGMSQWSGPKVGAAVEG